jgi:hypothetical protein
LVHDDIDGSTAILEEFFCGHLGDFGVGLASEGGRKEEGEIKGERMGSKREEYGTSKERKGNAGLTSDGC